MASTLITNIKLLAGIRGQESLVAGKAMAELPAIERAWLLVEDDRIADFGPMDKLSEQKIQLSNERIVDAGQRMVLPAWCDSHTHIVFAGSREQEFVAKIRGKSYAEINAAGGGILNSAIRLNACSEDQLFADAWKRVEAVSRLGTGALEIKSGYGLTVESELKMLRVIRKIRERSRLRIKSTFLGAHAYPAEFRENHEGYIRLLTGELLPVIAREKLADYIDVFCEQGFFSLAESEIILRKAKEYGLVPKIHVNQLNALGGVGLGIRIDALSLDHLEVMNEQEIEQIVSAQQRTGGPMATLLPTAAFFLSLPMQPGRKMIDAGCAVALASDYNPGSSPSGNMNFVLSLSCIQMRLLPEEAINAATLNGAFAMGLEKETGSITRGKIANLIITAPVPSLAYLPYSFGTNLVERVMIGGEWVN